MTPQSVCWHSSLHRYQLAPAPRYETQEHVTRRETSGTKRKTSGNGQVGA